MPTLPSEELKSIRVGATPWKGRPAGDEQMLQNGAGDLMTSTGPTPE